MYDRLALCIDFSSQAVSHIYSSSTNVCSRLFLRGRKDGAKDISIHKKNKTLFRKMHLVLNLNISFSLGLEAKDP